jgi:phosphoribosylformylglycinamidine synthase
MDAEVVHIKRFLDSETSFSNYDGLIIPGGFSFGDHVRAGALLGKILKERFSEDLIQFSEERKPILGICNGFQTLVECGLLPGQLQSSALSTNVSSRFECRWVWLKIEISPCIFTEELSKPITLPVAHGEGRFLVSEDGLNNLQTNNQIALTYADSTGHKAGNNYPENPNGSLEDIAGVCNRRGNVFGLMPHPERAFHTFTHPDWTKPSAIRKSGDGFKIFSNMVDYIKR